MYQIVRLQRAMVICIILLAVCLAIIVPFEMFNEMQSLHVTPVESAFTQIRMINFFDLTNVTERATEAMYVSCAIAPADYGIGLNRLVPFIRQKVPMLNSNIKNYSRQCVVVFTIILCFFIFYQSSRTTSDADSLYGLNR